LLQPMIVITSNNKVIDFSSSKVQLQLILDKLDKLEKAGLLIPFDKLLDRMKKNSDNDSNHGI
jgi:hypothetical protein